MIEAKRLLDIFQGDAHAVRFALTLNAIVETWDDLHDGDRAVAPAQLDAAFTAALVELPRNPFYRAHFEELSPLVLSMILGWRTANAAEEARDPDALEIGHVLRYLGAHVLVHVAAIKGGADHAAAHALEVWRMTTKERLADYVAEVTGARAEGAA